MMGVYCHTHGRRTNICGCSRSYPCLVCGGLFPTSDHVCPEERVRAAETSAASRTGNPASGARSSVSGPHSKPRVSHYGPNWFVDLHCCPGRYVDWYVCNTLEGRSPYTIVGSWHEAMDAAHAHVREVHKPQFDLFVKARQVREHHTPEMQKSAAKLYEALRPVRETLERHPIGEPLDPEPAQAIWAEALDRSMNGSRDS